MEIRCLGAQTLCTAWGFPGCIVVGVWRFGGAWGPTIGPEQRIPPPPPKKNITNTPERRNLGDFANKANPCVGISLREVYSIWGRKGVPPRSTAPPPPPR